MTTVGTEAGPPRRQNYPVWRAEPDEQFRGRLGSQGSATPCWHVDELAVDEFVDAVGAELTTDAPPLRSTEGQLGAAANGVTLALDVDDASSTLLGSTIELRLGDAPGMTRWRKRLFVTTSRITADAAEYFGLPRDHTVIMGSRMTV